MMLRSRSRLISSTGKRAYAGVHQGTVVGRPPQAPKHKSGSDLNSRILSALPRSQKSLPELIKEYNERSGYVLGTSLPYESRPSRERRVNFDDDSDDGTVAMIAHCAQRGDEHKLTTCSGFALKGINGQSYLLTCAHTLDEMIRSPFLNFDSDSPRRVTGFSSGSFAISGSNNTLCIQPVLSAISRSDVILLSTPGLPLKALPLSPYPAPIDTSIRAHFVSDQRPDEPGWKPWVGGMWSKWVRGKVVGYRDFAGRQTQPGTYDALSHMFFDLLPKPGASGGPIVDEESGAVVGVVLGTMMDNRTPGMRGWGVPSEAIFEMFSLPGLDGPVVLGNPPS